MAIDTNLWFPLFEFQEWSYESFLLLPTESERGAPSGAAVTGRKWAKGDLLCGQAFRTSEGYSLDGTLSFGNGINLSVSVRGALGTHDRPATFEGTGSGTDGPVKGTIYRLVGWVFPGAIQNGAARVASIRGSVWAVRGPDGRELIELGGMPVGTVGAFVVTAA